jgi:two-component system CAI-1 autoinducer sensor kinase/phosphatase CqsS
MRIGSIRAVSVPKLFRWLRASTVNSFRMNYRYARRHLKVIALFGVIGEPFFYFAWRFLDPDGYENFILRMIGFGLCVPLLFADRIERRGKDDVVAVNLAVAGAYCLPFFFCVLLLQNANAASAYGATPIQWPMQYTVALVLMVLLFPSGVLSALMFSVSTAAAWLLFLAMNDTIFTAEINRVFWGLMPVYLFIIAAGSIFNRNREIIDQEKLAAVAAVGSTIAHELRTPCMGIKALAEGIQSYLPILVRGYEAAVENGLQPRDIRVRHVDALRQSLVRIKDETDYANRVIDMLLISSSDQPLRGLEFTTISAATLVRTAIDRYPFSSAREKERLTLCITGNFSIAAPEVLLVHVLFNLLKNAIYYVGKSGDGQITIRLSSDTREIVVEDTGTGISSEHLPRIFDRFFTTTENGHGSGIGLSFCRMVMDGIGGTIECDSEPNEPTRFTLTFPESAHG